MAWSASAHPRAAAGSPAGGQFSAASSSSSSAPKRKAAPKGAPKPKGATRIRNKKGTAKTVTVKKGDTLSAIARRNHESLAKLKKDNPGLFTKAHRGGNLIFPGNKVKIGTAKKTRNKKSKTVTAKLTASKSRTAKKTPRKASARIKSGK